MNFTNVDDRTALLPEGCMLVLRLDGGGRKMQEGRSFFGII